MSMKCPNRPRTPMMAISLGMNVSVISWIWVTAWNTLTARPTSSPTARMGPAMSSIRSAASRPMESTWSGVTAASSESRHERAHHEVPAVGEHEEQDLERQGDHHGRQHHHAHRHEDARHHHVDDEERDEQREADLKRGA